MHRLFLTFGLALMFSVLPLAAFAQTDIYGDWATPPVSSAPTASYLGQTGLLITPTAMVAPPLQGAAFYHAIQSEPRRQALWGAVFGLPGDLEASVVRMVNVEPQEATPGVYRNETVLNGKYQIPLGRLTRTEGEMPKVALGIFDASNTVARVWYLSLSHAFPVEAESLNMVNLHAGWGNKDHGGGRLDGFFAGMDFAPSSDSLIQVEYDGVNLNGNIRYYPARWVSIDLGVVAEDFAWGATANTFF